MKFKVEIEIEIFDEELVELINYEQEDLGKELYNNINEIPKHEILSWCNKDNSFIQEEITDFGFDINNITIIE